MKENSADNLNFATAIARYAEEGNDYTTNMMNKAESFEKGAVEGRETTIRVLENMRKNLQNSMNESSKVAVSTTAFTYVLQGINHEIENCDHISDKMRESLLEFREE